MRIAQLLFLSTALSAGALAQITPTNGDLVKRSAALTLKVSSYSQTQESLNQLVAKEGAEIVASKGTRTDKGRQHGWFRIVVPRDHLDSLVAAIRALGKPTDEVWKKEPQEGFVAAIDARLARLAQHELRMKAMLNMGRKLRANDILFINDRVFRSGVDQDRLAQEKQDILGSAKICSVSVTAFEPYLPTESKLTKGRLETFTAEARNIGIDAGQWFATTLLRLLLYSPIWLPALFIARKLYKKAVAALTPPASPKPPAA